MVFDGSHNPEGIEATVESIRMLYAGRILLLSGVMRDKEYGEMIALLSPITERVYCVRPDNPRALDPEELAATWRQTGAEANAYQTVEEAMRAAVADARESDRPLFILGSLYLYREARDAFEKVTKM